MHGYATQENALWLCLVGRGRGWRRSFKFQIWTKGFARSQSLVLNSVELQVGSPPPRQPFPFHPSDLLLHLIKAIVLSTILSVKQSLLYMFIYHRFLSRVRIKWQTMVMTSMKMGFSGNNIKMKVYYIS